MYLAYYTFASDWKALIQYHLSPPTSPMQETFPQHQIVPVQTAQADQNGSSQVQRSIARKPVPQSPVAAESSITAQSPTIAQRSTISETSTVAHTTTTEQSPTTAQEPPQNGHVRKGSKTKALVLGLKVANTAVRIASLF